MTGDKFTLLPPDGDLIEAIAAQLHGRKDLPACTVVFPNSRPSHFLRKKLFELSGKSFECPAIYSMDNFVSMLAEKAGAAGPQIDRLDAAGIMLALPGADALGPLSGQKSATVDWLLPWALKAFTDFEDIRKNLVTPEYLAGFDSSIEADEGAAGVYKGATGFSSKFGGFSKLYGAFYSELKKNALLTQAMKYAAAAASGAAEKAGLGEAPLILAGFFLLTASERKLIENLFKLPGFRLLAQEGPGLDARFKFLADKRLIQPIKPYKAPVPAAGKYSFYKAADTHSEVFALGGVIDNKKYDEQDVIVIPSAAALFPVVHNVLPDFKENNIAIGYPISHTPVYSLVDFLGRLLDRADGDAYFIPDYLRLVFHPYVKNTLYKGSPELTRILFQSLQEYFLERMTKYVALSEIEEGEDFIRHALGKLAHYSDYAEVNAADISKHIKAIHNAVIRPFEKIKSIGDFSSKLLGLVSFVSGSTTAARHPYWKDFSGRFLELLDGISGCRLAGQVFAARSSYFRFFGQAITGAVYPFEGTPVKGLQVLGLLETRGIKFRRVYFLDANADALNVSGKEDAVLSEFMRGLLGLPGCREKEAERKYHFETLLGGAESAKIFYRDNSKSEKSPFVEELLFRLESAGADREKLENRVFFDLTFKNKEPSAIPKNPWIMNRLGGMSFSPSALNHYLACPLRFYYIRVLGLEELEEVTEDISRASIGNIVHKALEFYFLRGGRLGKPFKPDDLKAEFATLLLCLQESMKLFHLTDTEKGYSYVMRRQVEKRLEGILRYHATDIPSFTPLAVEASLEAELTLKSGKKARLAGKADRIDLRVVTSGAEGLKPREMIVIVDYKTGSMAKAPSWRGFNPAARGEWIKTLKSVQLPVYAIMAKEGKIKVQDGTADLVSPFIAGRPVESFDARLMMLGKQEIFEESLYRSHRGTPPDIPSTYAMYREAVCTLLDEILDPALAFEPTKREDDCRYCPFKVMCGRQWVKD